MPKTPKTKPPDWTPKSRAAEWHLTYRCDLACRNCNRLCYLPPATVDMTLDDARAFVDQARALAWSPTIYLLGGEPTLHPDVHEFASIAAELSPGRVTILSNGYSRRAQTILDEVRRRGVASILESTIKPAGSVDHSITDNQIAPVDLGLAREPCRIHAGGHASTCGISVDAEGYTVCALGGAIDGWLRLGVRTRRLADLFDPAIAAAQTQRLCERCGCEWGCDHAAEAPLIEIAGVAMSPTWQQAVRRAERATKRPPKTDDPPVPS